jgi:hypothetical protein
MPKIIIRRCCNLNVSKKTFEFSQFDQGFGKLFFRILPYFYILLHCTDIKLMLNIFMVKEYVRT